MLFLPVVWFVSALAYKLEQAQDEPTRAYQATDEAKDLRITLTIKTVLSIYYITKCDITW